MVYLTRQNDSRGERWMRVKNGMWYGRVADDGQKKSKVISSSSRFRAESIRRLRVGAEVKSKGRGLCCFSSERFSQVLSGRMVFCVYEMYASLHNRSPMYRIGPHSYLLSLPIPVQLLSTKPDASLLPPTFAHSMSSFPVIGRISRLSSRPGVVAVH